MGLVALEHVGSSQILDRTLHWSPATSPALVGGFFTSEPPRNPTFYFLIIDKDNQVDSQLCGSSLMLLLLLLLLLSRLSRVQLYATP